MSLFLGSCNSTNQTDERENLITEFISAVENFDTLQLFSIVDTSKYFSIQDKNHFIYQVAFLREQFKECGIVIIDSAVKINRDDIPFTDYTYSFCRGEGGKINENSFDLKFTFADFDNKKIYYFEVFGQIRMVQPTKKAPGY